MNITMINGSPKIKESASGALLNELKSFLPNDRVTEYHFRTPSLPSEMDLEALAKQDVLILAFPLYVDSIPSHVLNCLCQLEDYFKTQPSPLTVYAIVNCGFFEGEQNRHALDTVKNWCVKSGLHWGQGLGIGGGGMIPGIQNIPAGKGPRKNFSAALKKLAGHILDASACENIYISPNFPRLAYQMSAEMEWNRQIKANGLSKKDLDRRL